MRIGIDYSAAVNQGAGIGRYARQLVQALLELDEQNEYVLLVAGGTPTRKPELGSRANVHVVNLPISERALTILWQRLRLPLAVELFVGGLDLFHSPDFSLPPVRKARTVLTVHDLSFMRLPQCSLPSLRSYLLRVVPRSVRRADVVLADSESTQADVIQLLDVDADRVRVIYPGVEQRFQPVGETGVLDAVRRRYNLPTRFVLSVGTLQPRKNYERLIEAYAQVRAHQDIRLVIAGGRGWMYEGILRRVEELGLHDEVCFAGYVADEDLPALYSMADLYVFPSLYEGFGLPPLEAMACGTPVVTSNASSLPEVVGQAARMVDPLDVSALAEAMLRVLGDPVLHHGMVQRGLAQARRFTWSRAAAQLLSVYQEMG